MLEFQIKETDFYGLITNDCLSLDDKDFFDNSLVLMELYKIKCFISKDKSIIGMQIKYRDKNKKDLLKEYQTINIKININCVEQEFIFEKEEKIINITIYKNEYLKGFEILTNKNRNFLFGSNSGNKIMLNEFSSKNNIVIGFYSKFDKMIGLTGLGFYYVSFKEYIILLYSGIFYLRAKLQDQKYYNSILNNIEKLEYSNKALVKLGMLPKSVLLIIMKYLI